MLTGQWVLAVDSLQRENPTIDEVIHLPAGVSYWERGTFRLYPHNPPLIKLIAAWPVVRAQPNTEALYRMTSWNLASPDKARFGHEFMFFNAARFLDQMTAARLMMPPWAVLGGVVVLVWSTSLFGRLGGLLSLGVWTFCPNILAHARLVTTDVGATALGAAATWLFVMLARHGRWRFAAAAGLGLGLAMLAKFSMLLLFALWPLIWLAFEVARRHQPGRARRLARAASQAGLILSVCLVTINLGYLCEQTGQPLGSFEFTSALLTRPASPTFQPGNDLLDTVRRNRVNRFRGSVLESVPVPLPRYFVQGFDDQKFEAEGVPARWFNPTAKEGEVTGYPVFLNGELRGSGWRTYYLYCLLYKVPESTLLLWLGAGVVALVSRRGRSAWPEELALGLVPATVFLAMTFATDINIGLRYVLPMFPYLCISAGRLAPWALGLGRRTRGVAVGVIVLAVLSTAASALLAHPHYLAYFNQIAGGPRRGAEHLIDSNLDWGQDLLNLQDWLRDNAPGERVGLAYFGQIHPNLLASRGAGPGQGIDWFVPAARPDSLRSLYEPVNQYRPEQPIAPGLYAVSASLVKGLPWRLYDPEPPWRLDANARVRIYPAWSAGEGAFSYFQRLAPIATIGHSIWIYRVSEADARRLADVWRGSNGPG